jgi:hypothetical protein
LGYGVTFRWEFYVDDLAEFVSTEGSYLKNLLRKLKRNSRASFRGQLRKLAVKHP